MTAVRLRVRGRIWAVILIVWTIAVVFLTWSTWPPTYISRDDLDGLNAVNNVNDVNSVNNVNGGAIGVKPELVVLDANTANRTVRSAALLVALKLWMVPIVVCAGGFGMYRVFRADS